MFFSGKYLRVATFLNFEKTLNQHSIICFTNRYRLFIRNTRIGKIVLVLILKKCCYQSHVGTSKSLLELTLERIKYRLSNGNYHTLNVNPITAKISFWLTNPILYYSLHPCGLMCVKKYWFKLFFKLTSEQAYKTCVFSNNQHLGWMTIHCYTTK